MAKNVMDEVRRRQQAQAARHEPTRSPTTGQFGQGFRKSYSDDEWARIEAERRAMRERLISNG